MDFAKRMLEKYGWSEGQGLGKDLHGMKTALKPKAKFNLLGLGHDRAQEFTYRWWEDAFNEAATNVNVVKAEDGPRVETIEKDSLQISAVKRSRIKRDKAKYGTFIKVQTLTKHGLEQEPGLEIEVEEKPKELPVTLSDEQLFKACGGLTAHKGARHGLTLSGKLRRVREQEEALLEALEQSRLKESETSCDKKLRQESEALEKVQSEKCKSKKEKKSKTQCDSEELPVTRVNESTERKRKKERKLERQNIVECHLKETEECEIKESKKGKKKRKQEMAESSLEVKPESILNPGEDTTSGEKKRKKKKKKEEEVCYSEESHTPVEKQHKKKKRKTETFVFTQ